eukprot:1157627-Pelagomonas_calceolata.AAC.6
MERNKDAASLPVLGLSWVQIQHSKKLGEQGYREMCDGFLVKQDNHSVLSSMWQEVEGCKPDC